MVRSLGRGQFRVTGGLSELRPSPEPEEADGEAGRPFAISGGWAAAPGVDVRPYLAIPPPTLGRSAPPAPPEPPPVEPVPPLLRAALPPPPGAEELPPVLVAPRPAAVLPPTLPRSRAEVAAERAVARGPFRVTYAWAEETPRVPRRAPEPVVPPPVAPPPLVEVVPVVPLTPVLPVATPLPERRPAPPLNLPPSEVGPPGDDLEEDRRIVVSQLARMWLLGRTWTAAPAIALAGPTLPALTGPASGVGLPPSAPVAPARSLPRTPSPPLPAIPLPAGLPPGPPSEPPGAPLAPLVLTPDSAPGTPASGEPRPRRPPVEPPPAGQDAPRALPGPQPIPKVALPGPSPPAVAVESPPLELEEARRTLVSLLARMWLLGRARTGPPGIALPAPKLPAIPGPSPGSVGGVPTPPARAPVGAVPAAPSLPTLPRGPLGRGGGLPPRGPAPSAPPPQVLPLPGTVPPSPSVGGPAPPRPSDRPLPRPVDIDDWHPVSGVASLMVEVASATQGLPRAPPPPTPTPAPPATRAALPARPMHCRHSEGPRQVSRDACRQPRIGR